MPVLATPSRAEARAMGKPWPLSYFAAFAFLRAFFSFAESFGLLLLPLTDFSCPLAISSSSSWRAHERRSRERVEPDGVEPAFQAFPSRDG
jgi:hypothetical protein